MIEKFIDELKMRGFKQREIAEKAGITQSHISKLIRGEKPSIDVVIKLADAYKVSTDHILGRNNV